MTIGCSINEDEIISIVDSYDFNSLSLKDDWWFNIFLDQLVNLKEVDNQSYNWSSSDEASDVFSLLVELNEQFDLSWVVEGGYAEIRMHISGYEACIIDEGRVYSVMRIEEMTS